MPRSTAPGHLLAAIACFVVLALSPAPASAQLTVEQKLHDFENLAGTYARRYAPLEWKKELLGFDLLDLTPWLDRVARSADDLEYFEIALEYVASLDDTHTSYVTPSSFVADLGFTVDIYDDRVVIDSVNRARLPLLQYPFGVGDVLLSIDGRASEDWIADFSRLYKRSNPLTTRRAAADFLTFRPQSRLPRAVDLDDEAIVVIERQNGLHETYLIPWRKTGVPMRNIGPVISPSTTPGFQDESTGLPSYYDDWLELTNFRLPGGDPLLAGQTVTPEGEEASRRYVLGLGQRAPVFAGGLPPGFVQRLGRTSAEFHFSGTYESEGLRIGYLRLPSFSPSNTTTALQELAREVAFFEENTDGLVVDVMRNPGGNCYMLNVASYLIPYPFYFFGEEVRATLARINSAQATLDLATLLGAPPSLIEFYTELLRELSDAYYAGRSRTAPIAACSTQMHGNQPAQDASGNSLAYTKPLIVLVDEFSISAGDIFPAMLQDNARGPLVGTRTNGAGGAVTGGLPVGTYSEASASNTNTLVVRRSPVTVPGYPTTQYIENVGAHADIPLNYMTRANLLTAGRPFVEEFTRVIVDEIRGGYVELVSRHSGKCLDVFGASTEEAATVVQWSCHGGPNQQWRMEPVAGGGVRFVARHSDKVLDVYGASMDDASPAIQYSSHGGDNQIWMLETLSDGYVRIVARHSGKALDVSGASVEDGAEVIQYAPHGGANQQWLLRRVQSSAGTEE